MEIKATAPIKTTKQPLYENWLIDTDYDNVGKEKGYQTKPTESAVVTSVPGIIQESFPYYYGCAWYWKKFFCTLEPKKTDRIFLRFGAVDYKAFVWVNGVFLGDYEGGESQFEFDVTDVIKYGEGNLIAVRVINTCNRTIDGLNITNTPNRNKNDDLRSGYTLNFGGMIGCVDLLLREAVAVTDVFTKGDIHTGDLNFKVTVANYTSKKAVTEINLTVAEKGGNGPVVTGVRARVAVNPGTTVLEYSAKLESPLLWSNDDPNLYGIRCELESRYGKSVFAVRFGLRDFRIVNGWFYLNDKRLFLKCAHSGNAQPYGIGYAKVKDFVRRDFVKAKDANFNTVRVCAFLFRPEQLDFCDEIGLMVMDECFAAWFIACEQHEDNPCPLGPQEEYLERFDRNTAHMFLQDRNHACITMYEFLNETQDTDVFRRAVAFLPKARELDDSRLILLSSGRFDADFSIGCAANPGVNTWTKVWGADKKTEIEGIHEIGPSCLGSGDVHLYPWCPHTEDTYDHFFALGKGMRPIFLSEYGIGTQFHVIHEARSFEQHGVNPDLMDYRWVKKQTDDLLADFSKFGFDRVYPFAETMLNESQRLGARQRNLGFNLIRSNPQICGFSITGLLDHGMCGEGLWTLWRRWKPGMYDTVADGYSPLRFCLFTYPTNAYAGRPMRVKASLATEDALRPGKYSSTYKIVNDRHQTVWEKSVDLVIGEDMPLAVQAFDERIILDVPTGKYTLYANLNEGGSPTGDKLDFWITNEKDIKNCDTKLYTWGVTDPMKEFLLKHGVKTEEFDGQTDAPVIVGNPGDWDNWERWDKLKESVTGGNKVAFLCDKLFVEKPETKKRTGFENGFECYYIQDHLYHKEVIPMPHPVFDGVEGGMFDLDYVGDIFPHEVYETDEKVDIIASSFLTGSIWIDGAYKSFYEIIEKDWGKGKVILNALYLLETLDRNPMAGLILMNLVKYITD